MRRLDLLTEFAWGLAYIKSKYGLPAKAQPPVQAATTTSWKNISATGQTFTPKSTSKGYELRCLVTAHNSAGHATVHTPSTSPVK